MCCAGMCVARCADGAGRACSRVGLARTSGAYDGKDTTRFIRYNRCHFKSAHFFEIALSNLNKIEQTLGESPARISGGVFILYLKDFGAKKGNLPLAAMDFMPC